MYTKILMSVLLAAVLISACGGQTDAPPVPETIVEEAQPAVDEAAPAEQTAPAEPAADAPQPAAPAAESGMMSITSPEKFFTLEVPNGWSYVEDTEVIENVVVETYTAPDGHAFVQVVVNEVSPGMNHVIKGEVTMDYMRRLYGDDLRVSEDVTLKDGRERLKWWNDYKKTSGTTFFDTARDQLFFYTTTYDDAYEKEYKTILEDVNNSYSVD